MRYGVLGQLLVTADHGEPIGLASEKERGLVAALVLHRPSSVSADRLADALWNQEPPRTASKTVQNYVLRLRSRLGRSAIETAPGGYRLSLGADEVDVVAFEESIKTGLKTGGTDGGRVSALEGALRLWRGRPYLDLGDWPAAVAEAARLEELRRHAEEERAAAILELGGHDELVGELEALVAAEPLREGRWALLMLALYRSGRQADALRTYAKVRKLLGEELGIAPGQALQELEQAILLQSPSLQWTAPDTCPPATLEREQPISPSRAEDAPETATEPVELPRGTVALLFTDLEGVGDLWDRFPIALPNALARQEDVLLESVARHHGFVLPRAGDSFAAAFARTADGIVAALDAQLQLAKQDWGEVGQLLTGIAVHAGEAVERGGHYSGPTVNRVTGLSRAAHGGQILLSAAARELASDSLPPEVELIDLGSWSFPGLTRPERVFQLAHPHLHDPTRRLRSGRPSTGVLPAQTTTFVDRQAECRQVNEELSARRLVTLTGEGGVGKTRLALEVATTAATAFPATTAATAFPDGVWFCDVSSVDDEDGVLDEVARALGLRPQPGVDLRQALLDALRFADLLLVIDNCEHLTEPVARLIDAILASAGGTAGTDSTGGTRVIATSREPLRVPGERVVRLQPLPDQPAVTLLVDRATAAGATVDLGDPSLVEIAHRLDGIPLALELAAARTVTIAPADLAARLDRRFELLTTPTAPRRRQRTLRAAIDWSYDLLDGPARDLFAGLAVCAGGWTLDAAEQLAGAVDVPAPAVARLMADLVDKSMIRLERSAQSATRYAMLDTLREYGTARLAERGKAGEVAAVHAAHYVALAERVAVEERGPHEGVWVGRLAEDFDNIRTAFHWSMETEAWGLAMRLLVALVDEMILRERFEVGRWAEYVLSRLDGHRHPLRGVALAIVSNLAMVEGRMDDAAKFAQESISVADATGGPRTWVARNTLALLVASGLVPGRAEDHLEAMTALAATSGQPMAGAVALFDRALLTSFTRRPEEGMLVAEELVALGQRHGSPSMTAMGLLSMGRAISLSHRSGPSDSSERERAAFRLHEALDLATAARSSLLTAEVNRAIVELEARHGDRPKALGVLRELLLQFAQSGDQTQQLHTILSMLDSLVALNDLETAAVICGALARTPWGMSASVRMIDRLVAERLPADQYLATHEMGASMTPAELVVFTADEVGALVSDRGSSH